MAKQLARPSAKHMPLLPLLPAAASVAMLAGCCCAPATSPTQTWMAFESPERNFKVSFPIAPAYSLSGDGREHRFTAEYNNGRRLLRVGFERDYNQDDTLAERFRRVAELPGVAMEAAPTSISLGEHPGMEAVYKMQEGESLLVVRHRIYNAGSTSYQVVSVMQQGEDSRSDEQRFFNSFQLSSR